MICIGCGAEFLPSRAGHRRCNPNCGRPRERGDKHKARRERSTRNEREFIGVDGEGVTTKRGHEYVLLTVGEDHVHRDGKRLSTADIFAFLYACFERRPRATYVGYYLGYDFAQWLRDLPQERAWRLLSKAGIASRQRTAAPHLPPYPVDHDGWEFDLLPNGKRFKLRPHQEHEKTENKKPWMTICDVGSFFQCSFLKAIDPAKATSAVVTPAEFALIAQGKDGRREHKFGPEMIRYNALECAVLARLMEQQNVGLVAEGIKLRRTQWIGPGQAAQQWLRNIEAPKGEDVRKATAPAFRDGARAAYYGGWFEIFWHGPHPGVSYSYDINSAYPDAMRRLPCLLHGRHVNEEAELTLIHARVSGRHPTVGAMLHRSHTGKVLRPRVTEGWFWRHEIDAAKAAGFIDRIHVFDIRGYQPCGCAPPIAAIADLYEGRLRIGKNTPAGKAKKLIYNSGYGKFAQSVGEPVFANAIYASLITSRCRTAILRAIASHPHGARDLLMVATDSVTFSSRHTALDIDESRLGAWTESVHSNLSLFMPGVYWDDDTRQRLRNGDDPVLKSRGIAARDLARRIETLDRAWKRFERDGWPRLVLPISFQLVSPRQALAMNKWRRCGAVITTGHRIISADPIAKRIGSGPGRSMPYQRGAMLASTPYEGRFGEEAAEFAALEFGDHPDGPLARLLPEVLHG